MSASFYKLKDDSWGVRIKEFAGEPNMEVEVTTKAGDTKTVILSKRVAKFDDAELWSLAPAGTVNVSQTKPAAKPAPVKLEDEEPF
jgi:hypothetical protein